MSVATPPLSAGEPIGGKDGRVLLKDTSDSYLEITSWEGNDEADMVQYGSSHTNGKKKAKEGNSALSGTVEGNILEEQVMSDLLKSGDEIYLQLVVTDNKRVDTDGKKIYIDAPKVKISNLQYSVNTESSENSKFSFSFVSNGDYNYKHDSNLAAATFA